MVYLNGASINDGKLFQKNLEVCYNVSLSAKLIFSYFLKATIK